MTTALKDFEINIKIKLSALWVSVMFCYIYGDFFSLFVPGRIEGLIKGHSGTGLTTPYTLLTYAVLLSLPPVMIFLSLILKPKPNRLMNIIMGLFFTLIMLLVVGVSIKKWMIFYVYLGMIEIFVTCLIIVLAWRWPRKQPV